MQTPAASTQAPVTLSSRAQAETFYEVLVAEMLADGGDIASAYELLMRAGNTRSDPALFQRATEIAFMGKDGDRALRSSQAWQKADPSSRDANKAVLQILLALNHIPQTQWHLKQELLLTPESEMEENLRAIPLIYQRVENRDLVLQVVSSALEPWLQRNSPWQADALATLGRLHAQAKNLEQATHHMQQGFAINRQSGGVAFLALELLLQGQIQAAPIVRAYAANQSVSSPFLLAYARLLLRQQNDVQALATLKRLTAQQPDMPEAWLAQAALLAGTGEYGQAELSIDQFDLLLDALPDSMAKAQGVDEAFALRAKIALHQGQHERAAQWLGRIQSPEQHFLSAVELANFLAQEGQIKQARALIQALPDPKGDKQQLKTRAEIVLLRDSGHYQQAYELHKPIAKTMGADLNTQYEHALLAERAGHTEEMERILRRIIKADPDFHHAKNALGYSLADRGIKLQEARQLIEQALAASPGDPFITDSLAWLEYREGKLELAKNLLLKSFNTHPDAEIAAHLGEVFWVMQQPDEAREIWIKGLLLSPSNPTLKATIKRFSPETLSVPKATQQPPAQKLQAQ